MSRCCPTPIWSSMSSAPPLKPCKREPRRPKSLPALRSHSKGANFSPFTGYRASDMERNLAQGLLLQRLFSTLANGWPGKGLLVLRLSLASFVVHDCIRQMAAHTEGIELTLAILYGGAGLLLMVGLWTPITASLIALFHA